MSVSHFWQYVLNTEGQPVPNVNVHLYTVDEDPITIYTSSYISPETAVTSVISDDTGLFEFWIGDITETNGYNTSTTFSMVLEGDTIDTITIPNITFHFAPPRIFHYDIPDAWQLDNGTYSVVINHNLGTLYPIINLYDNVTGLLITDWTTNAITIGADLTGVSPTNNTIITSSYNYGDTLHITMIGDDIKTT